MISLPSPPTILGFPEKDMPIVRYRSGNEIKQAKWTGRIHGNGYVELHFGYSFMGTGLSLSIPPEDLLEIVKG